VTFELVEGCPGISKGFFRRYMFCKNVIFLREIKNICMGDSAVLFL
jgi:hypothetical protein